MSASKKLKALDEQCQSAIRRGFSLSSSPMELVAALPQIVAVVEAAERTYEHVKATFPAGVAVDPVFREHAAVLAALDEALV